MAIPGASVTASDLTLLTATLNLQPFPSIILRITLLPACSNAIVLDFGQGILAYPSRLSSQVLEMRPWPLVVSVVDVIT